MAANRASKGNAGRARRARKSRGKEDGITIFRRTLPSGRGQSWNAQWRDPISGKVRTKSLDKLGLKTAQEREDWAADLRDKLAAARLLEQDRGSRRDLGLPRPVSTAHQSPAEARDAYLEHLRAMPDDVRPRPATIRSYEGSLSLFVKWCEARGVKATADLTAADLTAYADHVKTRPKRRVTAGKVGAVTESNEKLSRAGVAHYLREAKVFANWLEERDLLVIGSQRIAKALKAPRVKGNARKPIQPLSPREVRDLLKAARRHDKAQTMVPPSAVALSVFLLSGLRLSEALRLRWADVDLDPVRPMDEETGQVIPEAIQIHAAESKRHWSRSVPIGRMSRELVRILRAWRLRNPGDYVLGGEKPWTQDAWKARVRKLREDYAAPHFSAQRLRQTAESMALSCQVFNGNNLDAADAIGHSPSTAHRYYQRSVPGLDRSATTIEAAAGAEKVLARVLAPAGAGDLDDDETEAEAIVA